MALLIVKCTQYVAIVPAVHRNDRFLGCFLSFHLKLYIKIKRKRKKW